MKLQVKVTDNHIKNGKRSTLTACPVALAVNDALKGKLAKGVLLYPTVTETLLSLVGKKIPEAIPEHLVTQNTKFTPKEVYIAVKLPDDATVFINSFDNGYLVEPFDFELEIPRSDKIVESKPSR